MLEACRPGATTSANLSITITSRGAVSLNVAGLGMTNLIFYVVNASQFTDAGLEVALGESHSGSRTAVPAKSSLFGMIFHVSGRDHTFCRALC